MIWSAAVTGVVALGATGYYDYVVKLGLTPGPLGAIPSSKRMMVPTGSMLPTLQIKQNVDVNLLVYLSSDPKIGDIVVFPAPAVALHPNQGKVHFFKRVVGLPGDVVEVRDGKLFRNGRAIDEPYVGFLGPMGQPIAKGDLETYSRDFKLVKDGDEYWPLTIFGTTVNGEFGRTANKFMVSDPDEMSRLKALPAAAVPAGFCIVMGDNRLQSYDSRSWGLLDLNTVIGRVEL